MTLIVNGSADQEEESQKVELTQDILKNCLDEVGLPKNMTDLILKSRRELLPFTIKVSSRTLCISTQILLFSSSSSPSTSFKMFWNTFFFSDAVIFASQPSPAFINSECGSFVFLL